MTNPKYVIYYNSKDVIDTFLLDEIMFSITNEKTCTYICHCRSSSTCGFRKTFLKRSLNCFTQMSEEGGRKNLLFDHFQIRDKSPTLVGGS